MYEKEIEQITAYLKRCREKNMDRAEFTAEKGLSDLLLKGKGRAFLWLLCRAGYEPKAHISYQSGSMKASEMVCCHDPYYTVTNKTEYKQVLQDAGRKGVQRFRVLMPRMLLERLTDNDQSNQHALEKEAGVVSCKNKCYPEYGMILYTALSSKEIRIQPSPAADVRALSQPKQVNAERQTSQRMPILNDMTAVRNWIKKNADVLADNIEFACSPNVYKKLFEGTRDLAGEPLRRIKDVTGICGIFIYTCSYDDYLCKISLKIKRYYPGFQIIRSLAMHKEMDLPIREKQTLKAARDLLAAIHKTDPADLALAISKEIGQRTIYTMDENTEEDDCAIGALVNRAANCDGYADAFYLCAALAGLTVAYQFGCSSNPVHRRNPSDAGRHAWNLLRIDHQWTIVDVTWDHNERNMPLSSLYFMMGKDRAEMCYRWNHDMYPTVKDITDLHRASGIYEYRCRTRQEIEELFCAMEKTQVPSFVIFPMRGGLLDSSEDIEDYIKRAGIRHQIWYEVYREFRCWRIILQKNQS